jgi:hypothetical protein
MLYKQDDKKNRNDMRLCMYTEIADDDDDVVVGKLLFILCYSRRRY